MSTADKGRKQDPRKRKHKKRNESPKQLRSARISGEKCVQNQEIRRRNGMLFICRKGMGAEVIEKSTDGQFKLQADQMSELSLFLHFVQIVWQMADQ